MIEYSPRNINERIDLIIYRFIYKGIYPRVLIEIKETSNNYLAPSKIKEIESDCEKLDRVHNKIIELSNEGIYPRSVGNSIRLPWLYFFFRGAIQGVRDEEVFEIFERIREKWSEMG